MILISGCSVSYRDVRTQIKPGMSYQEVTEIMGTPGQIVEEKENCYQWYLQDFVRVIMDFSTQETNAETEQLILYKYEIMSGCDFIKIGMKYKDVVRLLGKPYKGKICWKIHDTLFLLISFSPPDTDENVDEQNIDEYLVNKILYNTTDILLTGQMG